MSDSNDSPTLHPTRIDMPLEIRVYVVTMLNRTLASTLDLRSQVKQAAWNVKGAECLQLRAFFSSIATELDTYTDLMAARIGVLGGVARGTVRTAALHSALSDYPEELVDGPAHAQAMAECFARYATAMRADIVHTMDVEDAGTASIYTEISRKIENQLGVLDAYLHR